MAEQSNSNKKILAGIFFIVGILLTVWVILVLGKDRGLVQKKFQIQVLYNDVGGLVEGAPILLSGVHVGIVSYIGFMDKKMEGRSVQVILKIYEEYRKQLNQNAVFAVKTEGILGEKLIEITVPEDGAPLDTSKPMIGDDPYEIQDLAEVFSRAAESFTETSEDFNKINFKEISDVVGTTASSLSVTADALNKLAKDLEYMTKKTRRLIDRLEQKLIDGNLFKVF
jgi:phospholipid/cholesterol/gamma-HCH transport system substrate-binding protein